jgi:CheY-like chemotaxis protein
MSAQPVGLGPGEYVVINVSDEGAGMDAELVAHAMEPFYTTKPEGRGTGLGLPMVHGLARQCGGALVLDSEPGRGTRAGIHLPAAVSEPSDAGLEPSSALVGERAASSCVLLVEDETTVRRLAARILRDAGYTVVEAGNGEDALRRAETLAESLDVVVSDVVMPALSGTALVRALRSERPELPVVLMSGYANDAEGSPIPDDVVFLLKPFGRDRLCEAVERALRTKTTESA